VDVDNCGECGNDCASGSTCCEGDCRTAGDSAFDEDRDNCGACGVQCPDTGCGLFDLFECDCSDGECQN
jgi:hypothetical protein